MLTLRTVVKVILSPRNLAYFMMATLSWAARADATSPIDDTNSPFEDFKAFIESPPMIEHIVVRQKLPASSGLGLIDSNFLNSANFKHFEARWQPGAVFYRDLPMLASLTNWTVGQTLIADYGATNWLMDREPWIRLWVDEAGSLDRANSVFTTTRARLRPLWEVLAMGIQHIEPGKIKWVGNSFKATLPATNGAAAFEINGELIAGTNGLPEEMKIAYKWDGREARWMTRYSYETPLALAYLPSSIKQYFFYRSWVELGEFEILEFKPASNFVSESRFRPDAFIKENKWPIHLYTNGAVFAMAPSGELKFLETQNPSKPGAKATAYRGRILTVAYVFMIGFNIWIFGLSWRLRNVKETEQLKKEGDKRQSYETQIHAN